MCGIFIVKIDTVVLLFDFEHFFVSIMLQNELLDEEKCLFVLNVLSDLNHSTPCMRSKLFFALITLCVSLNELYDEGLLNC